MRLRETTEVPGTGEIASTRQQEAEQELSKAARPAACGVRCAAETPSCCVDTCNLMSGETEPNVRHCRVEGINPVVQRHRRQGTGC